MFGSGLKPTRKKKFFFVANYALIHPPMASVLLSASVERCFGSCMRDFLKEILNPYCITGSKVMAILLNGWILPVGGVALGRVCAQPAKQT